MSEGAQDKIGEGVLIGGKYRLVRQLGVGGMGVVWSATHLTLGHQVAIKFLLRSIMESEEARTRFDREARLAARLGEASRHITRVIDHGVTEDRVPFLVMELLRGESLSARLKKDRRLSLPLAALIVRQLSRALHVAHSAGVIHRDLKPANIFLCTPEQGDEVDVKLLDFGVAKATSDAFDNGDETTHQGKLLGTPSYMSPEQILTDQPVDCRADLWAVAAIVYRMVVGRAPFGSGPLQEIGIRVISLEPLPPSLIWPDLPRELDSWMERGLAKKPEVRFQNARELSDFLTAVGGGNKAPLDSEAKIAVQRNIIEGTDEAPASTPTVNEARGRPRTPRKRRRAPLAVFAVAAAALAIGLLTRARGPRNTAVGATVTAPSVSVVEMAAPPAPSPSPSISVTSQPSVSAKVPATVKVRPKGSQGSGWGNKHEL